MEEESRPWMVGYRVKVEGAFNSRWQGKKARRDTPSVGGEILKVFEFGIRIKRLSRVAGCFSSLR